MSKNYSKKAYKDATIQAERDIRKFLSFLGEFPEAADYVARVTALLDGGGFSLSSQENEIIGSKFFSSRYITFPGADPDEVFEDQKKEESRLKRIRDYYKFIKEYEKRTKKKEKKNPVKNANSKKEATELKNLETIKKKSDQTIIKTSKQAAQDFINSQDKNLQKAVYDFQTRWNNNNEKVGNVFSQNYEQLKQDFDKFLVQAGGPYLKKALWYRTYASRYGLEQIAQATLECLIKRTPLGVVAETINNIQEELNDFKRNADTVITESLNIADQLIGIAEEIKDTESTVSERTKKIKNQYKDYKNKLKSKKVPTKNDTQRSRVLQQFAKVLLPIITTKVASVLASIIQNQCNENDQAVVSIPSIVDRESFKNSLQNTFGYDADTGDQYLSMLQDVSGFLTPVEICRLFNGESSDEILNSLLYFISIYYKNIFIQLGTTVKISAFFEFIGQLVSPSFCKEIEFSSLGDDFCFEPDSYEEQLRECLKDENPDLLDRLREGYVQTKKKQLRDALEFSFYPFELKGEQKALNEIFRKEEIRRKEEPLLELAAEYESQYNQSLLNLPSTFIKEQQRTEIGPAFQESIFAGALDDLPKEQREAIDSQIPVKVTRLERYILPSFSKFLFLRNDEAKFSKSGLYHLEKKYSLLPVSIKNLRSVTDSLLELQLNQKGSNQINVNLDEIYFNSAFEIPDYSDAIEMSFETKQGKYKSTQVYDTKSYYLYPGARKAGATRGGGPTKAAADYPEISAKTEYQIREKRISVDTHASRKSDAVSSYDKFLSKAGYKLSSNNNTSYDLGFKDTYNKLANICANSVFAKKIPIGLAGPSDNGNVSGLEIVRVGQEVDPECSKNLVDNFGMISFKRDARQAARTDVTDFVRVSLEDEEDDIREKYFNEVMSFKTHVLDFITKSIFLFSEFNFEKNEVDDSMIDYVYIEYFKSLVNRDIATNVSNLEFDSLTEAEKKRFIDTIYAKEDVSKFISKYQILKSAYPSLIAKEVRETITSKYAFEQAQIKIEQEFIKEVLDGNLGKVLYTTTTNQFGSFSLNQLRKNIINSNPYRNLNLLAQTIPGVKQKYLSSIDRLTNIINRTEQLGKDIGYLVFDMKNAKLKDLTDPVVYTRMKERLGNGGLDDVLDDIYKDADQWNKEWDAWHKNTARVAGNVTFNKTETYQIELSYINYRTNLWGGGHVITGTSVTGYGYVKEILALDKSIKRDLQIYAKEIKEYAEANREAIALQNQSDLFENLIDELTNFKKQQDNIKYNITYDTSRSLLHYHNENYPKNKTEDFCEAVRNLICHEISNNSKTLKEIIYTPQMRGERVFDIKDRMVEKQLNIFHSNNPDFKDDIAEQLGNILSNTIGGEYPYYETAREIDEYMDEFLPSVVRTQVGQTYFHMTKVQFDPAKDKHAQVDVYLCRSHDTDQLKKAGLTEKEISAFSPTGETKVPILEKDYIKKTYKKVGIDERTANSRLGGPLAVDIPKEVQKLFDAMDGVGTYENQIFGVLELNTPENVVRIQRLFNAIYINVEGYGTLEDSLRDELSGRDLERAMEALERANQAVRAQGGLKVGAFNFVQYPDFNNLPDDPFNTRKSFGEKVAKALGVNSPVRFDRLYSQDFRWISNAKYPASSLSQYFGRKQWKIDDYKHRTRADKTPPNKFEHTLYKRDYNNNPRIKGYLIGASREIVPNYISIIDDFKTIDTYYKTTPILSFKVDASNYKDFVSNYKKQNNNKQPKMQQYLNSCLKHAIIEHARKSVFENSSFGSIYSESFPLHKMLSHIAINMNKYVTYINSLQVNLGDGILPNRIKSLKGMEDFSFFNQESLISLGLTGLTTGLSLSGMDRIKVANANLSVGDILQLTQSLDNSVYFIKSTIKYFLRNIERADVNIQVSKAQADAISSAIRRIYSKTRSIVSSAEKIGRVFGADTPGQGIPSAADLDNQFKGMRYLFNLPVTPFAVANWFPGGLFPSNIQAWIAYVILETTLITIEILEDSGALKELEKLLFGDDANNSIAAAGFNYETLCLLAKEEALKQNPIVKENQKTLGGEYLLPDGREYIGEYHIHKDGTVMVGGKHPKDQPTIVLTEVFKRDDIDV